MSSRHRLLTASVCGLALLATACGNRLSEEEILAKNLAGTQTVVGDGAPLAPGAAGEIGGQGAAGTGGTAGTGTTGTTTTGTGQGGGSTGSTTGASAGGGTHTGTSGTGATGAGAQNRDPVTVCFIGALSGAGGVFVSPMRDAWQTWAKMVNAAGGINGHPVKVLVGDDGINDARALAIARDCVENQGAIALSWSSNDINGIAKYAAEKKVPVIGTQTSQAVWYENPYMFPMGPGYKASAWATVRVVKNSGAKKLAIIYCVEAPASCKNAADLTAAEAPAEGVEVVYVAGSSIAASDYTAECLQARNKGAEAISIAMDQGSLIRFVQSCHRQNYFPIFLGPGGDDMKDLPDMDGLLSQLTTFPWFLRSGSPGIVEYAAALKKYAPNLYEKGGTAQSSGWLSAKIFQAAATKAIPADKKPTSAQLLQGLWSIKGDTVLGLAQGGLARTYVMGKPANNPYCVLTAKLSKGAWTSPTGLVPSCR